MTYPRFTLESINKIAKLQGTDLGDGFVCKFETRKMGAWHVKE